MPSDALHPTAATARVARAVPGQQPVRGEAAGQPFEWHVAEHRGWKIYSENPPIPDRRFDYQASDPNGDGEPVATGRTIAECKADIDRIFAEREDELRAYVERQDIVYNLNRKPVLPEWALWLALASIAPFAAAYLIGLAQ